MRIPHWLLVPLLIASLEAHALQRVDVTDGQSVTVKVSTEDLTRIAMADGRRIERVWGLEDHLQVEPDRDSGQLFLRPVPGVTARPFSFFVQDDQGTTYTVLAVPVDMPSDTVLLRPKSGGPERNAARSNARALPYVDGIKRLVRALARGALPEGYAPVMETREIPLWAEARLTLLARYAGDFTGEVYELTNVSAQPMRLDEREFAPLATDIQAVAIVDHSLAPAQSTRVYLIRKGS